MTKALRIRTASVDDAPALTDLAKRTFIDTFAEDNQPADMQAYLDSALSLARIQAELSDEGSLFLLAFDNGKPSPCGYARVVFPAQRPETADTAADALELSRLYVDKAALGHGVGAGLMHEVLELARQRAATSVWLGVWEHNHRALGFYRKWGFDVVGQQSFLLGTDLQTDLVMALDIA